MKVAQIEEFGGPDVLKTADIKEPRPNENEVKVTLYAAGVNPSEAYTISGNYAYNVPDLPYVPGADGAGVVETVGANVDDFEEGDRVYLSAFAAERNTGTYAEKVVLDAKSVYPLPHSVSFNEGAGLGIPAFTAYRALFQKAEIKAGEIVMIHGGSGAVGSMAVQMAKAVGAIVIGTSSTNEGRESILDMGADYAIPHVTEENKEALLTITDNQGPAVIIEFLANVNLETDSKVIADAGRIIVVGSRDTIEFTPRNLMTNGAIITGMVVGNIDAKAVHEMYHGITAFIESGVVQPIIGDKFPLDQAAQALNNVMETPGNGRTIIEIAKE